MFLTRNKPDIAKIPPSLRALDWRPMHPEYPWEDAQQLLVAVPVVDDSQEGWGYELSVVVLHCCDDEEICDVSCDDDTWGWKLDDVDWYVVI